MSGRPRDLGLELARAGERARERTALDDGERRLTYGELLDAAGALAATIPPAPGSAPVALLLPHRAGSIVALVAALLAGRPYCVLNPMQPRRRIEALIAELEPCVVWASDASLRSKLEAVGLESRAPLAARAEAKVHPRAERRAEPGELCALYATSGSSGAPKLVGYRHEATHHRAVGYAAAISATPGDRFSLASPLWTAAAASALFTGLLSGASLHLLDPAGSTPSALARRVWESAITVWHSTPSLFRRLAGAGLLEGNGFRVIRLGGEPLLGTDVEQARRVCAADALLVTGYSITEANGVVTQRAVPLGRATPDEALDAGGVIEGVELWIEDAQGRPAPAGEEGEIVVGGELLSGGYAGAAEPDGATRFGGPRGRTLRTGDRGVLRADGSLEVRGRGDRRLKVRGHRVDPAEVEAAALRHDDVLDAAAVPFAAGARATGLAMFAAADGARDRLTPRSLLAHLEELVPPEAMPAAVEVLDALPMTDSGKVDRLRLTRLAGGRRGDRRARRERPDPVAWHLLGLWRAALELDALEPDEDFFALGGDSLAAAEVCAGIEVTYGIPLEPAALLRHRTVRSLAGHVRAVLADGPRAQATVLGLNPGGELPPLFVVPGAGSEATGLVHFAEAIGPAQPVNVIQLPGADGRSRPLTRMDRITAHCIAAIRETGAQPPYLLAGTSFGGLVAYDLASELVREGLGVSYLGLFDAPAPGLRRRSHLVAPLHRFRTARRRQARDGRGAGSRIETIETPLRHLATDYRISLSLLLGIDWQPPIALRFRRLRAASAIAADRWSPPRAPVPLHLYRCEAQPDNLAGEPLLGWGPHAGDVRVRPLRTRHGRHIRPPAVGQLAATVAADLARTRERQAEPVG